MNKKAYQSPNITTLGGINNVTLGSGSLASDNANSSNAAANGS